MVEIYQFKTGIGRVAFKNDSTIYCLQETHFKKQYQWLKTISVVENKDWKIIYHTNVNQKKAGVAIWISSKVNLREEKITRDRQGHYKMIKEMNPPRNSNPKCVYNKPSCKICDAKTDKTEKKNRQIHRCSQRFQNPSLNNW